MVCGCGIILQINPAAHHVRWCWSCSVAARPMHHKWEVR